MFRNIARRKEDPTCDKHFRLPGNNFYDHTRFTIIKQFKNEFLSKSKICSLLEQRETFWILKLQTLSTQGLNISLYSPQDTTGSIT